jgi:hypothetical protein
MSYYETELDDYDIVEDDDTESEVDYDFED